MAKKKVIDDQTKYVPRLLEDIMGDGFGRYAKYIIQERALPDARDGLKPVQRRILYAMYHDGNTWDHAYRKSAKTVGLVIGNYHPHGDTSVYDAMVRMSQDWKVRLPLIDMHGNNGSIDDDPAAAMRYTEVRLAKVTQVMEDDLDKNTVEMAPNFDDTEEEPTVLPVPFPVMLVNGATGIAAGYATNMPPHNLSEVVDAAIYRIQNPDCSVDEILDIMPGPDFPTGGIVQGEAGIREAYTTGRGRIVVRGKCEITEDKKENHIIITEIPYDVIKGNLVRKMDELRVSRAVEGVLDVRDESDRNGMRIVIDVRKESDAGMVLNYFYKNTDLQTYYNYNNVAIIDKAPVQVGVIGLLDAFIEFRREVVRKRSQFELDRMEARCHVIEGLMKAVSILDEVIAIIRASKDKADSKKNLMAEFGFDEPQAEAIVSLRLYRLSNTDIVALREEFARLVNAIEETRAILESEQVLRSVITKELRAVKKEYGDARRTKIEAHVEEIVIDKAQMIPNERVMLAVTRDIYVKRVSMKSYTSSGGAPTGRKPEDTLIGTAECDTLDTLLLFTNNGNYASVPVWQIDEAKWKDRGNRINHAFRIDGEDKIVDAILVKDFATYAWIVTVSSDGYIKKTPVSAWQAAKQNRLLAAMNMAKNAEMLQAFLVYEGDEIAAVSKDGFCYRFALSQLPTFGIRARGVRLMNFAAGDRIACACVVHPKDPSLVFVTENGLMKRLHLEDIPLQNRPSRGVQICRKVKSNPSVITWMDRMSPSDSIVFYDPERKEIKATDIPFRTRDSGFSSVGDLAEGFVNERGIQECRIIDLPEDNEEVHQDIERISLFDA